MGLVLVLVVYGLWQLNISGWLLFHYCTFSSRPVFWC